MAILKCKQSLKIATFNIQTLTVPKITDEDSQLKTEELAWNMKKQSVEICGVQKHRQVHKMEQRDDVNRYSAGLGYELYTTSAWTNTVQAEIGRVWDLYWQGSSEGPNWSGSHFGPGG